MKKLILSTMVLMGWLYSAAWSWSQDLSPRGWSEWSARNWGGFIIEIALFILAVVCIYKLAGSGEDAEEEGGEELEKTSD